MGSRKRSLGDISAERSQELGSCCDSEETEEILESQNESEKIEKIAGAMKTIIEVCKSL